MVYVTLQSSGHFTLGRQNSAMWFSSSHRFYCTAVSSRWPAVRLYNSSTRADLLLIGTDHETPETAEYVRNLIKEVKPQVVAVELCHRRAKTFVPWEYKTLTLQNLSAMEGNFGRKIKAYVTNSIHNVHACFWRILTNEKEGRDFRAAIAQGKAIGADISFVDRDIYITMLRAVGGNSLKELWQFWRKADEAIEKYPHVIDAVISYVFRSDVRHTLEILGKPGALKTVRDFFDEYLPWVAQVIVHERDEYMVRNLREMKGSIVVVVGVLHVQGIQELWEKAELECGQKKEIAAIGGG